MIFDNNNGKIPNFDNLSPITNNIKEYKISWF